MDAECERLLQQVRVCRLCEALLPLGPRPVVQMAPQARIMIIGQAPGTRVHETGVPWNDPSGDTLRRWLQLSREQFYDPNVIAIMPMGFCYPGRGKSGDLPPRPECAPAWHEQLLAALPHIRLTLLIGQYAQRYYLGNQYRSLTETVRHWRDFAPDRLPLPHPSPRNRRWLSQNPWFEQEELPALRARVHQVLEL
ncbi:uracil-DNA glycosylase family protein [Oceanisphaera arctica]|uniref:Uracil-DNA glycosylase n=1 Tax=Oceanisphaera arctica TaxID=641510 RepID=A0A2P5TM27_9GAMM|nr:uracil-DNA glycosylase family protein [Oceanisphaera arctica]PPL16457.1 uracil-DNA glycosylase [Oceanisphaera arctica]GHA03723.1 IclR family transcriptional regulator [Oceanisphaera arctica]